MSVGHGRIRCAKLLHNIMLLEMGAQFDAGELIRYS